MLRAVLFDLGSTLIHSPQAGGWGPALAHMQAGLLAQLRTAGWALDEAEFGARFAALSSDFERQGQAEFAEVTTAWLLAATLQQMGAPPLPPPLLDEALRAYFAYGESLWRTDDGAHDTLRRLSAAGLRLGLISNAPDAANVRRLIDAAGLRPYFDPIIISAEVGVRKPNPRIFQLALDAWDLTPPECVMVGDSLGADILGAQLAGMRGVWVNAHAGRAANSAHSGNITPDVEISRLHDLVGALGLSDV